MAGAVRMISAFLSSVASKTHCNGERICKGGKGWLDLNTLEDMLLLVGCRIRDPEECMSLKREALVNT
ncbi:hypothetical protein DRP04_13435 [Archaeoglobales archaeon]|nr:MAG: hypothetical protein DRP04_13435 [Archaeoglobales archaeon]